MACYHASSHFYLKPSSRVGCADAVGSLCPKLWQAQCSFWKPTSSRGCRFAGFGLGIYLEGHSASWYQLSWAYLSEAHVSLLLPADCGQNIPVSPRDSNSVNLGDLGSSPPLCCLRLPLQPALGRSSSSGETLAKLPGSPCRGGHCLTSTEPESSPEQPFLEETGLGPSRQRGSQRSHKGSFFKFCLVIFLLSLGQAGHLPGLFKRA